MTMAFTGKFVYVYNIHMYMDYIYVYIHICIYKYTNYCIFYLKLLYIVFFCLFYNETPA